MRVCVRPSQGQSLFRTFRACLMAIGMHSCVDWADTADPMRKMQTQEWCTGEGYWVPPLWGGVKAGHMVSIGDGTHGLWAEYRKCRYPMTIALNKYGIDDGKLVWRQCHRHSLNDLLNQLQRAIRTVAGDPFVHVQLGQHGHLLSPPWNPAQHKILMGDIRNVR